MGLSIKQHEYIQNATRRWNIKTGATRSGKTFLDFAYIIPDRILHCTGSGLIVLMGNTQGSVNRNVLEPMRSLWGQKLVGTIRTSDNSVRLFGKKVYVLGADKKTSVARIQGTGMEYCYGDEVTTWSEEVFEMLKSRMDKPTSVFDGTCNPAGPLHWFKKFLDSKADIYHQAYTIDDNPFLPEDFVRSLKQEYAGSVYYDRYILGRWVRAEGIIYQSFNPEKHTYQSVPHKKSPKALQMRRITFAVDVGHSNATVFLAFGEGLDGRAYLLDEYYHSGREAHETKSPLAYARDFVAFRDKVTAAHSGAKFGGVYVDPSAAGFMAQLREAGVYMIYKAVNDVVPGIQTVASVIDNDLLRVHKQNCPHTLKEFEGYAWDEKAAEQGEDRPIKVDDHCMDAMRYYFHTRKRDWAGKRVVPGA